MAESWYLALTYCDNVAMESNITKSASSCPLHGVLGSLTPITSCKSISMILFW